MEQLQILTGVQESDNYPYGRLKCHITFEIEFKANKGFRFKTQTTNPKTGRINKPKCSTYSPVMVMHRDENDHIKPYGINITGCEGVAKFIEFLKLNDVTFTSEESQDIWAHIISCIRANAMYTRIKEGVTVKELLQATKVDKMINAYAKHQNIREIMELNYSVEFINNLKA